MRNGQNLSVSATPLMLLKNQKRQQHPVGVLAQTSSHASLSHQTFV
jgi:hypothetical protein